MTCYRFGEFAVDTDLIDVSGPDGSRDFEPQVFDVLLYLIEQRGRLVTKEELLDNVWGDRFVSESAMTTRIKQARRLLDDDGRTQWAIKTVHGRGYRFVPDVTTDSPASSPDREHLVEPPPIPEELRADARQLFCGRTDELAQALAIVDRGDSQQPHDRNGFGWVWVLGEPGIGKTRLAAEIARTAHGLGHLVLFGRNNEDLRVPYQPFIEIIRSSANHVDASRRAALLASLPIELTPLFPELVHAAVDSPSLSELDEHTSAVGDASRRYELYEAISEWLVAAAATRPLTIIVDDVHWAADSTLQLISHLQARHDGALVTIVATSRDTAPDINPKVTDLLAAGQGTENSTVVRLVGLSDNEALKLVGDHVQLDEVMRQTAGNPLLLQAVNPADGSVDMPSAVRRRLANLDQSVRDTLGMTSVIGLEFELAVAASAAHRDELDLLDDLEHAVAARILDDVGVDRFRFTHALIRSSLRDELSSARLSRMHGRVADALHEKFADDPRRLPALAHHTAEAAASDVSLRPVAVERLQRAADESMAQLSFDEATGQLRQARALADPADHSLGARLALQQGIAETRSGQNVVAVRTFGEAITAATATDETRLRIEAAIRFEDAAWRPGIRNEHSLQHVRDAIELLDAAVANGTSIDNEQHLRARLAIANLRAMAISGDTQRADEAFVAAHDLTRQVGVANLEAALLNVHLTQVRFLSRIDGSEELVDRLAELEPDITDGDVALHSIHTRLLHATVAGHFNRHRDLIERMTALQQRSHSVFWEFIRANQEAMEAQYAGDLAASEALAERCLAVSEDLPEEDGSGIYGLRMFLLRREQDRLASMAPLVRHVLAQSEGVVWTPGLALLLIETGSIDEAAETLADVKVAGFDLPTDAMWSTVMVLLTESFVQLGDVDACTLLREQIAPSKGDNIITGSGLICFGRAERYLGMLSLVIGDLDEAEEYLGVALEADAAGGSQLWSNESRLWLSRVRRAQGHSAEADAMLAVVQREARSNGFARLDRLATTELNG